MTYADHGEGYWQGIYIVVKNNNLEDGVHTVHATIDDVKVIYDDKTDTWQFQNDYAGSSNVVTYNTFTPYFPANVVRVDNTYVGIAEVPIADLATVDMCSGIRKINIANFKKISGIELRLDKIYKEWNVPTDKLAEVKVLLNDDPEKVFCETTVADDYIELEDKFYNLTFKDKLVYSIEKNYDKLKQSLVLLGVAVILMAIAGVIEVYLTVPIANFILSIFG